MSVAVRVSTADKRSCWRDGTGTLSADGRRLAVNASGSACVWLGEGTVTGDGRALTIEWACKKPDGSYCGWPDWTRKPAAM